MNVRLVPTTVTIMLNVLTKPGPTAARARPDILELDRRAKVKQYLHCYISFFSHWNCLVNLLNYKHYRIFKILKHTHQTTNKGNNEHKVYILKCFERN